MHAKNRRRHFKSERPTEELKDREAAVSRVVKVWVGPFVGEGEGLSVFKVSPEVSQLH